MYKVGVGSWRGTTKRRGGLAPMGVAQAAVATKEATVTTVAVGRLTYELERMQARILLNRFAGRDVSQYLEDDERGLDLVIDDVLSEWQGEAIDEFWRVYSGKIEYAEGSDNEYREGFADGEDLDTYLRAVWKAHVQSLI